MQLFDLREVVRIAALEMSRAALCRGTGGNISGRDPETGLIAITPSGIDYESLTAKDITVVDVNGNIVDGELKPSSETPMHTAIYRARAEVMGIVHTHSPWATAFAVINKDIPAVNVPLVAMAPVPVVPFELPGSEELGKRAVEVLGDSRNVALLQNHGALCLAANVSKALSSAFYLEEGAQVALLSLLAGGLNPIPESALEKMRAKHKKGLAL